MQKALVINNKGAGFGNNAQEEVVEALRQEHIEVCSCIQKLESLDPFLEQGCDMVVVAGGDGTVKAVAMEVAGKNIPLYIWPAGTSNNIATAFDAGEGALNLQEKALRKLNFGRLRAGEKNLSFLESAGTGLISRMMYHMMKEKDYRNKEEKIRKSLKSLQEVLQEQKGFDLNLFLDGKPMHGKYLAVEVMNIPFTGPRLPLAPKADPGDGLFDVVLIKEEERSELEAYLEARLSGRDHRLQLPDFRARKIEIAGEGLPFHADDEVFSPEGRQEMLIYFEEHNLQVFGSKGL